MAELDAWKIRSHKTAWDQLDMMIMMKMIDKTMKW